MRDSCFDVKPEKESMNSFLSVALALTVVCRVAIRMVASDREAYRNEIRG